MIADVVELRPPPVVPGQYAVIISDCRCGSRHVVDLVVVVTDAGNRVRLECGERVRVKLSAFPGLAW